MASINTHALACLFSENELDLFYTQAFQAFADESLIPALLKEHAGTYEDRLLVVRQIMDNIPRQRAAPGCTGSMGWMLIAHESLHLMHTLKQIPEISAPLTLQVSDFVQWIGLATFLSKGSLYEATQRPEHRMLDDRFYAMAQQRIDEERAAMLQAATTTTTVAPSLPRRTL